MINISNQIFGLEVDEVNGIPIGAIAIIKVLESDGHQAYFIRSTQGLMTIEALGMSEYASAVFKHDILEGLE